MSTDRTRATRCAIYTRKSTEEGLDQSFNSLEAQREACASFIESQRHEGWRVIATHYDDGGFSGGSMERPALQRLLTDIDAGRVDTVVVYKVDRLTRALADFAKIVEVFDAKGISFVSVTQQFNTTTSMGRLTLNVLLSFAQFEREVTGERIRDKIAASKRKGMWMGGAIPLGYALRDRKIYPEPTEKRLLLRIYNRYLELGCVRQLKLELDAQDIKSPIRLTLEGKSVGGFNFSRGTLYNILQNRIYIGQITHKKQFYPGEHEGIVPQELFDQVQAKLAANAQNNREAKKLGETALLTRLVVDEAGNRLTPVHTTKKGKQYRYYVTPPGKRSILSGRSTYIRVPAYELEELVASRFRALLASPSELLDALIPPRERLKNRAALSDTLLKAAQHRLIDWDSPSGLGRKAILQSTLRQVMIKASQVDLLVGKVRLRAALLEDPGSDPTEVEIEAATGSSTDSGPTIRLILQARLARCGKELRLIVPGDSPTDLSPRPPVPALVNVIARAHSWYQRLLSGEVRNQKAFASETWQDEAYVSRVMQCAFLAPDIVEAILEGAQPPTLTVEKLLGGLPMDWMEQRRKLGFAAQEKRPSS